MYLVGNAAWVTRWLCARPYLRRLRERPELGLAKLFDSGYYKLQYGGPVPAMMHYIVEGAFTGRNPHPFFDSAFYLRRYPEIARAQVNPLFHYLLHGAGEGRKPHPLFEPAYYAAQFPGLAREQALLHFVTAGRAGGGQPHPLFKGPGPLTIAGEVVEGAQFGQGD
jgi:hypothetical protein